MKRSILYDKSVNYSIQTIELANLLHQQNEYILSKQLVRCATSIGANIVEAKNAYSKKDFSFKLQISQKECAESLYWLELLNKTRYISQTKFEEMTDLGNELMKMIRSSILTVSKNLNS